jgi:hypothetical protein
LRLVKNLLEPQFIHMVNSDEEQLIVFWTVRQWCLKLEKLIDPQVGGVCDVFVVSGHGDYVTRLPETDTER